MQYDKNRYEIWTLFHPFVLFWVLFPPLILNELIFGQRHPKVALVDKMSDKPWMERIYFPCPHCETLNDARLWANRNSLGHWFGIICPICFEVIPCLRNIFSLTILAITFPLWYFPAQIFRKRWLEIEKVRVEKALKRPLLQAESVRWLFRGTIFGGFMWVVLEIIPQVWNVLNEREWDLIMMFISLPIWLVTGIVWGLFMRWYMNRKGKKEKM